MFKSVPKIILPSVEDRPVVGTYPTAEQARKAIGFLAEKGFPVERSGIVGSGLRLVETVLGRATALRSAGAGAGMGVWFGLLAGLLIPLFTGGPAAAPLLGGMVYGTLFGAAFGLVSYLTTRGANGVVTRRDVIADRYDIVADAAVADDARNLLAAYNWRTA
ncbi:MAG TPA: general stress protein [Nonomuraea sp.]|nr:general stress protein [Nonomuraea sp.]